jgi:hypothetical protein
MDARNTNTHPTRREMLKVGGLGILTSTLGLDVLAVTPVRAETSNSGELPEIQFDIGAYVGPVRTIEGIQFQFPPVHTLFLTARLNGRPGREDQYALERALRTVEEVYPFGPSGVFTFVAYGLPYFARLPQRLFAEHVPRLLSDRGRFALEEAQVSPTDVSRSNPSLKKRAYNLPVRIERNDLLFTLRSDVPHHLTDVAAWLAGSGRLRGRRRESPRTARTLQFTSSRLMFAQNGLPRKLAEQHGLSFAGQIHPQSPMWMGFADQHVNGAGPAPICTFQGNDSARLTTAREGDYFASGSIQHLSHVILDLAAFYAPANPTSPDPNAQTGEPFTERCQYMFRSNPIPAVGNRDQFTDGGGPAFLPNEFKGPDDALSNAKAMGTFQGARRIGHLSALQRSSRAGDGTPVHMRMDGPGLDGMDVPDGSLQPKLQFTIFVPTADVFATMRRNVAAVDLVEKYKVDPEDNGLERFLTATRRQNFLIPSREHRAFPLLETA